MMDDTATEQLSAYLDGDLTGPEIVELENRLSANPDLRTELEMLRGAIDMMRTHGPVQTPPSLYGDILKAVADEPMPSGFWAWLQRPFGLPLPALAVALVAVMVLGVTVTGAMVVNGSELLRPAVTDLRGSSASVKDDAPIQGARSAEKVAQNSDYEEKSSPTAAAPSTKQAPTKVAMRGTTGDQWADKAGNAAPAPDEDVAVGEGIGVEAAGTAEPEMQMNRGRPTYQVALRAEDLEGIASLYQRYAGSSKASTNKANAIASMESGTQAFELTLPSGSDRNAFMQELAKRYPGSFKESLKADDTITLDNAVVTLQLTVSHMAPASGGSYEPKYNTLRTKKSGPDDAMESTEPVTTTKE